MASHAPAQLSRSHDRWEPAKMSWWYDAIIDTMLASPELNKIEIAEMFRVTPALIYMITNSDIFKARFEMRRDGMSKMVDATISHRLRNVASRSLDIIEETLDKKRDAIPMVQLIDIADKTLNRLGYGVKPISQTNVQVNQPATNVQVVIPVSADDLRKARDAARISQSLKTLDGGSFLPSVDEEARPCVPATGLELPRLTEEA